MKDKIERWKREVLPAYCSECPSYCCARNLAGLSEEQIIQLFGTSEAPLNSSGDPLFIKYGDDNYRTNYGEEDHCPRLVDGNCEIYEERPEDCRQFPIAFNEESGLIVIDNVSLP